MADKNAKPGMNGNIYVPYEKRTGNESIVYFTRDLSPKGLMKAYEKVDGNICECGKTAIKLHTGDLSKWETSYHDPYKHVLMKIDWEDD